MRVSPHPAVGRVRKRADFVAASRGRRFHAPTLTVQGLRREGSGSGLRLGFTLTRKVGQATERNRIRRRLRAAAAEVAPRFLPAEADLVVIGRREALGAPYTALVDDLARAFGAVLRPGGANRPR